MPLSLETKCVHLRRTETDGCSHYGSVSFPIYQTATYAHPGVGESTGFDYSRLQNPTREQLEKVVSDIENELQNSLNHEIQSQKIGEMIMDKLKKIDEVAYVRFASVYREFKDLDTFMRELAALKNENR